MTRWVSWGLALLAPLAAVAQPASPKPPAAVDPKAGAVDRLDPEMPLGAKVRVRIFKETAERKKEIKRREGELERELARLRELKADVRARYQTLRLLQGDLRAAQIQERTPQAVAQEAARKADEEKKRTANTRRLSKVFEKMKAAEAAQVVPQMDEDLVVQVLLRVKERQAAKIMGALKPELAARLSEKMALLKKKRRRRAPKR